MINYDKLCTVVPVSATEFFTAKHCVILGQDHWIIEKDGTALLVDSFRISPDHDLALGVVDGVFDQYAVPSVELPMYGDPLELQGWSPTINSDEPRPAVWIGLDGGENSEDGQVFAWAAGAVYPGDSGGGMFYNGRLLAIIVAYSALRQPDGSENPAVVAVMLGFGADLF